MFVSLCVIVIKISIWYSVCFDGKKYFEIDCLFSGYIMLYLYKMYGL